MELRAAAPGELEAFERSLTRGFHLEVAEHHSARFARIIEPERTLAWFDEGQVVATSGVFTRQLTVPGAFVDCAAVTMVTVAATHRRRGLLTAMMRRQLEDARHRGEPVAALWASEATIYGRFGYGIAARGARLLARRPAARLASLTSTDGLRAGRAGEHLDAMRAVHGRARPQRPGMLDRHGAWWQDRIYDPAPERNGATALQAAVVEDGYAIYAVRPHDDEDGPAGEVIIRELVALTPQAHAQLWGFLLDQDLTRFITWDAAPTDEPLGLRLTDPRALRTTIRDTLWIRLVDVSATLAARTYASEPDIVMYVVDAFCPWNTGRYRLTGQRTDAASDFELEAATLAAAYLGGTPLNLLAAAGRVTEHTAGAVARASVALRGDVEPWCPEMF